MGTTHWHDEDYFGSLVCGEEEAFSALEFLIDDLHVSKELTVHRFLGDARLRGLYLVSSQVPGESRLKSCWKCCVYYWNYR
ncbi:hypothetical protein EB796_007939 [Bugula neritina]|uniref:Uncharacterized protein n=1 Tax=Bugula neritina TaxID=10212 RepID=A0A7J7K679_BUGNE|nr:hypothetical protein EB796_007939 [Bugula neritina]